MPRKKIVKTIPKSFRPKEFRKLRQIRDQKQAIDMIQLINKTRIAFSKKIRNLVQTGQEMRNMARTSVQLSLQSLYESREYLTLMVLDSYDKRIGDLLKYFLKSARKYEKKDLLKVSMQVMMYLVMYIYVMFYTVIGYIENLQSVSPEIAQGIQEDLFNSMAATDYYLIKPDQLIGVGTALTNINQTYSNIKKMLEN